MISDLCKLVKVALTPVAGCAGDEVRLRRGCCANVNRTSMLLGQGSALISKGRLASARDVRRMRAKVLSHDFMP